MSFAQLPDRLIARIAAFSLIGLVNSVIGVAVIVIAGLFGASPVLANVAGYGVGLSVSFMLNSKVTFRLRAVNRATGVRFLIAFAVAFVANLAIVKVVTDAFVAHPLLGSLAGTPVYVVLFYALCEYWVFRAIADSSRHGCGKRR